MNFIDVLKKLYEMAPKSYLGKIRSLLVQHKTRKMSDYPVPILTEKYFNIQHEAVVKLLEKIIRGEALEDVLKSESTTKFGERIVEYPYFADWLLKKDRGLDILDVGCVLNNRCVDMLLKKHCNTVWFCNPVIEKDIYISNTIFYHVSSLEESFPNAQQFRLVTCFSTIEHIGYDNSQYGKLSSQRFYGPAVEPFIESFQKLADLTAPGGNLLVSFPYGYREAIIHPCTGKVASQVMDYASIQQCLPVLDAKGISYALKVFAATSKGWMKVEPKECHARYAAGCPGATAVALIEGKKRAT